MRLSIVLLLLALVGVVGGAALIGLSAVGAAIIFDSLCVGVWALLRDDRSVPPQVRAVPSTVQDVLDRARAS